ncbi:DNA helicase II UvrD [Gluconobacter frateurii NBRC 101659]|nr:MULTISPECIES: ATP-dependent helicase [unclassified Gluconobacter]GAP25447.1 DNA helicase II UvrD [Gluconobacter frateurii NBRC 101659]
MAPGSRDVVVDNHLSGLTPSQADAARQTGPVVVLAGAGTGKTKTLVAGIVDRVVKRRMSPDRILAVTFTNKAAGEMKTRIAAALNIAQAPYWVGTFHAHGRRQLRTDPDIAGLRPGFDVCDSEDSTKIVCRLLEKAIEAGVMNADDGETFRKRVKSVSSHIAMLKENMVLPPDAVAWVEGRIATDAITEGDDIMVWRDAAVLYPAYQAMLRESNRADFADLLLWPTVTMLRDERYRRDWADRFDCVLADEFQDVNRLQFLWLKCLSKDHNELFVVGDDAQSIYGWRGANVRIIRSFLKEFPTGRMIALEQNFRSTGHILSAANAVISHDTNRLEKTLYTASGDGEPVDILRHTGSQDEASGIAAEIGRRALEGVPYEDMAVLYRFNHLSRLLEESLLRARIPYELVNDTAFWQRGVVKDALAFLRLTCFPYERQSDEAFRRIVNQPARGIGAKAMATFEQVADEEAISLYEAAERTVQGRTGKAADKLRGFLDVILKGARSDEPSLGERLRVLVEESGYLAMHQAAGEDGRTALENLHELLSLANEFSSVEELFDHAALGSESRDDDSVGRVKLMTIHGSKGLEFGHVFLIGWEDTLFPSRTNIDPAEERRLAYVALTRGRQRVSVSWCEFRRGEQANPSCFIDEIPLQARRDGWGRNLKRRPALQRGMVFNRQTQREAMGF